MIKKITLSFALLLFIISYSQNIITAPFNKGFVGTTDGVQAAKNVYSFAFLGLTNVQFTQSSTTNQFVETAQGNDIIGDVLITDKNGVEYSIPGFIKWRTPNGQVTTMVFQPAATANFTLATNSASGMSTYVINTNKYIGLTFNSKTLTFSENGNVSGNAATTGLLEDLNSYLTILPHLEISDATATEGNPNVTLTVTLSAASSNTVTVNYATRENTAKSAMNYGHSTGSINIPPNSTTKTVIIPLQDNNQPDNNKTFYVELTDPTDAYIEDPQGLVTILDTEDTTLSVADASKGMQFQVAQNPVKNGSLVMQYANQKDGKVSVFDAQGKAVKTFSLKNGSGIETVDVSALPKGIYILVLNQQGKAAVVKIQIK